MHGERQSTPASARSRIWATIARQGRTSRTDISRFTSLSKGRISLITRELLDRRLIRECPTTAGRGRPAVPLEINPDLALFFGITFHCDPVSAVILDFGGRIRAETTFKRPTRSKAIPDLAIRALQTLAARLDLAPTSILGCGVSLPADIAADDLQQNLETQMGIPITVENDLNCLLTALTAESPHQPEQLSCSLVAFGETIGSAHMIEGHPLRGAHGGAGGIGHARIAPLVSVAGLPSIAPPAETMKPCRCGGNGCVETVASLPAILDRARREGLPAMLEPLVAAADAGETRAQAILRDAATVAGAAIATMVQVLDPGAVIAVVPEPLSTGLFADALSTAVLRGMMPAPSRCGLFTVQTAQPQDAAVGAARIAFRILMRDALSGLE